MTMMMADAVQQLAQHAMIYIKGNGVQYAIRLSPKGEKYLGSTRKI